MKITTTNDPPSAISSKVPNFTQDSNVLQNPISKKPPNRKPRYTGGGLRLKKDGAPAPAKKGSRPETPLLRWKFVEGEEDEGNDDDIGSEKQSDCGRKSGRKKRETVSARKLAAGLWRLRLPEVRGTGGGEVCNVLKNNGVLIQPAIDHSGIHSPARHNRKSIDARLREVPQSPNSVTGSRNKFLHKLEPAFRFSNSALEGATKWDPCSWKASEEVKRIYGESKDEEEQGGVMSMVSILESELETARARIQDLETERRASKKKLEQFLKKLNEERAAWRSREHEKIRAVIDDVRSELSRERKNRQRMEIVNSKLVNELADAKLSAKRYMQDYEKERKARELTEEVCDELAKEIGEDKAEIEALKQDLMKMREEVDDERKMLQMAEVWREERVQMKLVDAKVALEEKYSQMYTLVTDLETFLNEERSNLDVEEIKKAETLKECANSVSIQEISEFKYDPANPDDIFSALEEVSFGEMNTTKDIQEFDDDDDDDNDGDHDDESGWETVSNLKDEGSNYSPNGSDPSVTKSTRQEWEENNATPITEITEITGVCLVNRIPKKGSSISRFWKSNGENCKIISIEGLNGRLSNGTHLSNGSHLSHLSPDRGSGASQSEWSCSPGSGGNTHITKGMKGCIEWPRGQKNSLKSKLLEARFESQKVQLRQVLKQKL